MGVPIKSYEELRVYQVAFASAMEIYRLSKSWPSREKFSLPFALRSSLTLSSYATRERP